MTIFGLDESHKKVFGGFFSRTTREVTKNFSAFKTTFPQKKKKMFDEILMTWKEGERYYKMSLHKRIFS